MLTPDQVLNILETTGPIALGAGASERDLDKVRELAGRQPSEATIAVIGNHNAGKTSLIAAITDSPQARDDISADVQTQTSEAYNYKSGATSFDVWDTPGLGSEFSQHDREALDRVTLVDAVVLAVSTEVVSEVGRDQIYELLTVGRKKGAVLSVITKADREPEDSQSQIAMTLQDSLPDFASNPMFLQARAWLDALDDGETNPSGTGVPELREALEKLAVGEARKRTAATAAARLLTILEEVETSLASNEEPERQAALRFHQRFRTMLNRTERRLVGTLDSSSRKEKLAAQRAWLSVVDTLDARESGERIQLAMDEAWHGFVEESEAEARLLGENIESILSEAKDELDRLDAGPLSTALDGFVAGAVAEGIESIESEISLETIESIRRLLNTARKVGSAITAAERLFNLEVPVGDILGVVTDIGEQVTDEIAEAKVKAAKESLRADFLSRAANVIDAWHEEVDRARNETVVVALSRQEETEKKLLGQFEDVRERIETVAAARRQLDTLLTEATRAGYVDAFSS